MSQVLATSGNFTTGNVTALAGLGDDSRFFQISAPVQPGNSGGPLLDENGNLVGIVSSKLNFLSEIKAQGDIPQNVNFAIKASVAGNCLRDNNIKFTIGEATQAMKAPDLADAAKAFSGVGVAFEAGECLPDREPRQSCRRLSSDALGRLRECGKS